MENFWTKVKKTDNCWLWQAATAGKGYGVIRFEARQQYAHRVSWQLHFGKIPFSMCVLHKCDIPSCVNPEHLFLGTIADNNADMKQKGRWAHGEKFGRAVLNLQQVNEIRSRLINRKRGDVPKIAREMGIAKWLVANIAYKPEIWR